jgi:hypothetical protein
MFVCVTDKFKCRAKLECASESEALCELTHGEQEDVISASGLHILTLPSSPFGAACSLAPWRKKGERRNESSRLAGIAHRIEKNKANCKMCFFRQFLIERSF